MIPYGKWRPVALSWGVSCTRNLHKFLASKIWCKFDRANCWYQNSCVYSVKVLVSEKNLRKKEWHTFKKLAQETRTSWRACTGNLRVWHFLCRFFSRTIKLFAPKRAQLSIARKKTNMKLHQNLMQGTSAVFSCKFRVKVYWACVRGLILVAECYVSRTHKSAEMSISSFFCRSIFSVQLVSWLSAWTFLHSPICCL